jgi:inner membrane protein
MATIITHAMVGAALAPLGPRGVSRSRLAFALAMVSVIPDLDVIGLRLGIPYAHPLGHRGFSHSLLFAALLAALVARFGLETAHRWRAFFVLFAATASHGILDAFTDGGLGVGFLIPFSNARYFAPVRPLPVSPIGIDGSVFGILRVEFCYVWLPVLGLLATSAIWRRARTRATAPRSGADCS